MNCYICNRNIKWGEKRYAIFGRVMCSKKCIEIFRNKNPTGCKLNIKEEIIC